jgi:hypothetical protein
VGTSLVTVCAYCKSVVARGDRGLESLGKVSDLVETQSPLDVGLKGRFENVPFDLVGRTQYKHPMGGVWDEWYAAFADGKWGWLAEAQGRFYLTFERPVPADLPSYDNLQLEQKIDVGEKLKLTVAEKQRGQVGSALGEIPFRVLPGETHPFADLSGPNGEFATIDYSDDSPVLYVGRQVTLDELHIPVSQRRVYPGQEPKIQALQVNCPKCGAALELRAPDKSERVGCPSCGALSDVKEGNLVLLRSLDPPPVPPVIPLGSVGKREGVEWTVLGYMHRYVTFEGVDYFWEEYLLYQPRLGFRWLTRSDEHWCWVEAVPPASVKVEGSMAIYADRWYRLFQKAKAKVSFVAGEFYWKVQAGETVFCRDYVSAPYMLSEEVTKEGSEGEINWSHATYMLGWEVEEMFALKCRLPSPLNIGPNQPFPFSGIYKSALYLLAAALSLALILWLITPRRQVMTKTLTVPALGENKRSEKVIIENLELGAHKNIRLNLKPGGDAGWVHMAGSLIAAPPAPEPGVATRPVSRVQRQFAFLVPAGETGFVYLTSVPAGRYTLQFDLAPRNPVKETTAEVSVEQGVSHPFLFVITIMILLIVPFFVGLYQVWFEGRRWAESNTS